MATAVILAATKDISKGVYMTQWNWTTTATGHGSYLNAPMLPEKTFQADYVTGGTSRFVLEGTNVSAIPVTDVGATEWITLTNPTGGEMSATVAFLTPGSMHLIRENPRFMRIRVSTVTAAMRFRIISTR